MVAYNNLQGRRPQAVVRDACGGELVVPLELHLVVVVVPRRVEGEPLAGCPALAWSRNPDALKAGEKSFYATQSEFHRPATENARDTDSSALLE